VRQAPASLTSSLLSRKEVGFTLSLLTTDLPRADEPIVVPAAVVQRREPRFLEHVRQSVVLDRERHHRLKLAATKLGSSARQLMVEALDHYLATVVPARVGSACHCLQPLTSACAGPSCNPEPEPDP
jgi:hypothetical protein